LNAEIPLPQYSTLKMPIGQARLAYAIIMAIPIAIFMYMAIMNLHWLTINRIGYLFYGVMAGLLLGILESKIVLSRLSKAAETTVWEVFPVGLALFGVPFLAVITLLGNSEYAPFGLFAFFPLLISLLAVSGWFYSKYEKTNSVHVFVFPYGFKYWLEPNPDNEDRFRFFIQDIASKDTSLIWSHIGYSEVFLRQLRKKQDLGDSQTRESLFKLLKTMRKTQIIVLTHFVLTMVLTLVSFALLFSYFKNTIFSFKVVDVLMPTMLLLWVTLGVDLFGSMHLLKKKAATILSTVDSSKLSSV
jgi:hypothetical protein